MIYVFNGKNVNIPDKVIENYVNKLGITEMDAIQMWLDDNDYTTNEQVEELTAKAKANKTDKIVVTNKTKRKQVDRKPKEKPTKEFLIDLLWQTLQALENTENVKITNKSKLIEFCYNGKEFKLDLIEKRVKK